MESIYLIEKQSSKEEGLLEFLVGNFPVRVFSSFTSLKKLLRLQKNQRPFLIINNYHLDSLSLNEVDSFLDYYFPDAIKIHITEDATVSHLKNLAQLPDINSADNAGDIKRSYFIAKNLTNMEYYKIISHFFYNIPKESFKKKLITYKDLILNEEELTLTIEPNVLNTSLEMKQFQLLKHFILHPKEHLSREEIQKNVWKQTHVSKRTIDSQICRLRSKIDLSETTLKSVYNRGYFFE